jgi:hypothetical protein
VPYQHEFLWCPFNIPHSTNQSNPSSYHGYYSPNPIAPEASSPYLSLNTRGGKAYELTTDLEVRSRRGGGHPCVRGGTGSTRRRKRRLRGGGARCRRGGRGEDGSTCRKRAPWSGDSPRKRDGVRRNGTGRRKKICSLMGCLFTRGPGDNTVHNSVRGRGLPPTAPARMVALRTLWRPPRSCVSWYGAASASRGAVGGHA